jgi:hypothetical protein
MKARFFHIDDDGNTQPAGQAETTATGWRFSGGLPDDIQRRLKDGLTLPGSPRKITPRDNPRLLELAIRARFGGTRMTVQVDRGQGAPDA